MSLVDAANRYLQALRKFYGLDDLYAQLALQQASDDLLAALSPGIPNEHLASAFSSYLAALLISSNMSTRPTGANA